MRPTDYHTNQESFATMLSYGEGDAARAGAHGAGHAFAAGGRWAPEAEIGLLKADMKSDPSQRF